MAYICQLSQLASLATSGQIIQDVVLHVVDEHARVQFGAYGPDVGRGDETPSPIPYASSSRAPPVSPQRRGTRRRSPSPYPMHEYTPYTSAATYLQEDVRQFTSVEDAAAQFQYTSAPDYTMHQGSSYHGAEHFGKGSEQAGTQEPSTQVDPTEHQESPQPAPMPRRIQPVRTRRQRPCGT